MVQQCIVSQFILCEFPHSVQCVVFYCSISHQAKAKDPVSISLNEFYFSAPDMEREHCLSVIESPRKHRPFMGFQYFQSTLYYRDHHHQPKIMRLLLCNIFSFMLQCLHIVWVCETNRLRWREDEDGRGYSRYCEEFGQSYVQTGPICNGLNLFTSYLAPFALMHYNPIVQFSFSLELNSPIFISSLDCTFVQEIIMLTEATCYIIYYYISWAPLLYGAEAKSKRRVMFLTFIVTQT